MKLAVIIAFLALAGEPGAEQNKVLALSEVQDVAPMILADKLLPPHIRKAVIEGKLRRQFVPGLSYWAGYLTQARVAGADLCQRTLFSVTMANIAASNNASADTKLILGPVERRVLTAIAYPAEQASAAGCAAANGYVPMSAGDHGARQLSAYRSLISAMREAAGTAELSFTIGCEPEDDLACRDPRKSLATLPLDTLYGISTTSRRRETEDTGRVRVLTAPAIEPGEDYEVELSFGMSGPDGRSWRVSWIETGRPLTALKIARHQVYYH